jgi:hypothetical protein
MRDEQVIDMARAALRSYEWSCSWREAGQAAREHAMDEWGQRAPRWAVGLAVRLAQCSWQAQVMKAKREMME